MSSKLSDTVEFGKVQLAKRRGSRSIRISLSVDGHVRVNMPTWAPYSAGLAFLEQKKVWIQNQRQKVTTQLHDQQTLGKRHVLVFMPDDSVSTPRVSTTDSRVVVKHPSILGEADPTVQAAAVRGAKRALQRQADDYLPDRLRLLADATDMQYQSLSIRQLKSRWGSCSSTHHITLNYFLMLLPEQLIDYVLIHELAHTRHLDHSPEFWHIVGQHVPNLPEVRRQMRNHRPSVFAGASITSMA